MLKLQQGGTVRTDAIGVEKTHFPLRCKAVGRIERACVTGARMGPRSLGHRLGIWEEGVVTRLCDPDLFTGTASSGQPPTTVDLEVGAGVRSERRRHNSSSRDRFLRVVYRGCWSGVC